MRVVLATNQFPKFSETFIVRQLLGLLELGWDMHVVCPSSDPAQWDFYPDLRDDAGLRARVHVTRHFETTVAELRPDLVHFEFGAVAIARTEAVARTGAKQLVTFRGYDLNDFGLEDPRCYDEVWRNADAIHAVSDDLWRRAQRRGCPPDKRHEIVHDAVDLAAFTPEGREYAEGVGTPDRPLRVVSVGRLHWKKGYEFGVEAVRRLVDRGVRCEYRIVGDGEHRQAVVYTVDDLGLADVVRLEGARRGDEVGRALSWADVLLHNAVSEGFCASALEAQATGLPVVCTDAGGLPENVAHRETGIVVRRRDPAAAMEALGELAASAALRRRMGENGRRRAARFGFDEHNRRFHRLYRSLLAGVPASPRPTPALEPEPPREDALRVGQALAAQVPPDASVLVVSRGDDQLVAFEGWRASHFPQDAGGGYAGFYPTDSGEAIGHLEELRAGGAQYLVFPPASHWWLEHYRGLRMHLETSYRVTSGSPDHCVVVALGARDDGAARAGAR